MTPRPLQTAVLLIGILLAATLVSMLVPPALQRTVTETLIKVVVVIGLYIFVGNSGIFSFGHVAFMSLGAYGSALLTLAPARKDALLDLPPWLESLQLPWPVAMILVTMAVGLVALVFGLLIGKLRGIAPAMATFALLMVVHVVASNWQGVTGGRQALVGLPRFVNLWVAYGAAAIAILIASAYAMTGHSLLLRASRENEVAASATGVDIGRERLIAFVISAMVMAAGGILYAHFVGTITANIFYLDMTFVTLTMLVVGGSRSLTGAVVGVVMISAVSELLRSVERGIDLVGTTLSAPPGLQEIVLSVLLLTILILRPLGLLGNSELGWSRPANRAATAFKEDN